MITPIPRLEAGKKVYFASDFHLGVSGKDTSRQRELKIVNWLNSIQDTAASLFIVGDIFDFWFEYKYTIPKGFIRLQGKLAEFSDKGIPVYFFTGNHDMWMFDYFPKELGIPVYREPQEVSINNFKFLVGHGDGLGPGDHFYKFLKKIFANRACQIAFALLPSYIGMGIANLWSKKSRLNNISKDEKFLGEKEWLYQYCLETQKKQPHDFYIFGHRHLPLDMNVGGNSRYINLGEWVNFYTYAEFDGKNLFLKTYE